MGIMDTVPLFLTKHLLHTQIVAIKMIKTFLNYLITLPKDVAPLGVAQDHPVHTTVFDHRRAADDISDRKHHNNTEIHKLSVSRTPNMTALNRLMTDLKPFPLPDLPGEGTLGCFVAILSSHTKLGVQLGPDKVQVDGWRTTHHLCSMGEGGHKFTPRHNVLYILF